MSPTDLHSSSAPLMSRNGRGDGPVTWLLFSACVILAAGNFVAVRFSNLELPPMWGAGLRFALAAAAFIVIASLLRIPRPRGVELRQTLVFGFFNFAVFYALMYWALVRVTAGTATIFIASVPLITLLLAGSQRLEKIRPRAVAGALLALAGIAYLTVTSSQLAVTPLALVALLLAAASIAQSIILGKRIANHHPAVINAIAMSLGAGLLLALSLALGEKWTWPMQPGTRWALIYLATFGSVGLFGLTLLLIRRWTPSASAYVLVVVPIVTLLLEAVIANVPVTFTAIVGAALVMAGVWFGALTGGRKRTVVANSGGPRPQPGR